MRKNGKIFVFGTKAEGIDRFCNIIKKLNTNLEIFSFHICELNKVAVEAQDSESKYIVLIRNPALRSFEMWKIMLCEGFEWIDDFELALAREPIRFYGAEHRKLYTSIYDFLYWHSSLYSERILSIKKNLGDKKFSENVLCLILDEFKNENQLVKALHSFLSLNSESNIKFEFNISHLKIVKKKIPYNSKIQYVVRAILEETRQKLRFEIPFLKFIMSMNIFFGKKIANHHWLVDFLKFAFRREVERLSEILKKDLLKVWGI